MAVEFGLLIPTREVVMTGRPETPPLLALAERAEAAGFDSVWIGDSATARPRHEPLTLPPRSPRGPGACGSAPVCSCRRCAIRSSSRTSSARSTASPRGA